MAGALRFSSLALTLGLLSIALPAQAQHRVELAGELEAGLLERLTGQLAELTEWSAVRVEGTPEAADIGDHDADALVWITADEEVISVWVADPLRGRLYVEQLDRGDDPSALYEAVAIVVRTALEALALGGTIGIGVEPRAASVPPSEAPSEGILALEPVPQERASWRVGATLAFTAGFDGLAVPHGGELAFSVGIERFTLSISARLGLPFVVEGERASLSLQHHRVAVGAAWSALDEPAVRLMIGLDVGAWMVSRTTVAVASGLAPTAPALTATASIGLAGRMVVWLVPGLGVVIDGGAEVILPTPRYEIDGVPLYEPWPILLRALAGLLVETGLP